MRCPSAARLQRKPTMTPTSVTRLAALGLLATLFQAAKAEGLYIGGNLGSPRYTEAINGVGAKGSPSGFLIDVYGGYRLSPNFALEPGFARLGHSSSSDTLPGPTHKAGTVRAKAIYLDGVGSLPMGSDWSALARAGVAHARFTTTQGNDGSLALKLGAGLQYSPGGQWALRLNYDHYTARRAFNAKAQVGDLSTGLVYRY
jgi:OOP family OmpA-OmpF porin